MDSSRIDESGRGGTRIRYGMRLRVITSTAREAREAQSKDGTYALQRSIKGSTRRRNTEKDGSIP
jgi:hypothetical protein